MNYIHILNNEGIVFFSNLQLLEKKNSKAMFKRIFGKVAKKKHCTALLESYRSLVTVECFFDFIKYELNKKERFCLYHFLVTNDNSYPAVATNEGFDSIAFFKALENLIFKPKEWHKLLDCSRSEKSIRLLTEKLEMNLSLEYFVDFADTYLTKIEQNLVFDSLIEKTLNK
ncbi:MAG: hypothetical protein ACPG5B_06895 [Chitinophagales bacterium]